MSQDEGVSPTQRDVAAERKQQPEVESNVLCGSREIRVGRKRTNLPPRTGNGALQLPRTPLKQRANKRLDLGFRYEWLHCIGGVARRGVAVTRGPAHMKVLTRNIINA
ncbi:unnamed protein product [Ceratitis capitata]|uniref:(Mediterranean fruit fly) hypothetical protein n=1 Tax=Ceratitis capitata TaxID=7213 RepID=A0A811UCW5_CERCA|nr:unnamed protein product [Ceratitis capitata]